MYTSSSFQECKNEQYKESAKNQKPEGSPAFIGLSVAYTCTGRFMHDAHQEILGFFTILLAIFTGTLWWTTKQLHGMAERQDTNSKKQQRAYIYGGGPYGIPNEKFAAEIRKTRQSAIYYGPPWQMAVYNYGRTPGTITKVEWGLIEFKNFPNMKVSQILERRNELPRGTVQTVKDANFICPPTEFSGLNYRHVEFPERKIGDVFFGRIDYVDVFGDSHCSTFKLRFTEGHSDPIDGGYEDQDT